MEDNYNNEDYNQYDSPNLFQWIERNNNEADKRLVFLNMDRALKYIHDHGFCVKVFYPSEIFILNNDPNMVQFKKLIELSRDPSIRKNMIKEDIFNSSFIQLGLYMGQNLNRLDPKFLKENFDMFTQFIPQEDINYYRYVILNGSTVYFNEYDFERRKRELSGLMKEFGEEVGNENGTSLVKSNGNFAGLTPVSNDKNNDRIYKQINGLKDAAYISYLVVPTLILISLTVITLISWFFSI